MKPISVALFLLIILSPSFSSAQLQLPAASPSSAVSQGIGLGEVKIEYSRPSLKGRKMFGAQVPYQIVWRTGANKVTNISFSRDMEVNGSKVAAGKYALLSIPTANEWTIILNKEADAWGAYTYKESEDVLRFKVKAEKLKSTVEHFTIRFDDFSPTQAHVVIEWENTRVKFPVKHDADDEIMDQIRKLTAKSDANAGVFLGAANYYVETNRDLNQAFTWATKALESNQAYWAYATRAKIASKIGKCDVAAQDAKAALPGAKEANDMSYVITLEKILKDCAQ